MDTINDKKQPAGIYTAGMLKSDHFRKGGSAQFLRVVCIVGPLGAG